MHHKTGPVIHYQRQSSLLLLPYLLGVLLLVGLPLIVTLGLSFFTFDGLSPPVWSGWLNFQDTLREPLFKVALLNSLKYVFLATPLRILAALGLALLLSGSRPGTGLFRAAVYLPTIVPDIVYVLLWLWILNPFYGPLNQFLQLIGLPAPAWLVDTDTALPALVMMSIFTVGEAFVVLLAALKTIPPELFETARVDGSNRPQMVRYIILPRLQPWLILLLIRDMILAFQSSFTPAYIMTNGGPYYATLFLPLLVFEEAFERLRFGVGSSITFLMILITLGLILLLYGIFQSWGDPED
jgi:multiple sugar transport system permease protein